MSIEAHRWALLQRTRSATTQCVLYVLANAAEPDGVAFRWWKRRDHWWPYITERACVTRATVFRVMEELAEAGLLEIEKVASEEGGAPTFRVMLKLERVVRWDTEVGTYVNTGAEGEKVPSHSETQNMRKGDVPSQPETELCDNSSHGETQATDDDAIDPPASLTVRLVPSQAETASKSPLKNPGKESPPTPSSPAVTPEPSKQAKATEPIGFAAFWTQYPDHETDNRKRAVVAFVALSQRDRDAATERVSQYAAQVARTGRRPVGAWRWLQEHRFGEYAPGAQHSRAQRWFVPEASEPWKAACALAAVVFATDLRMPQFWCVRGPEGVAGASVPVDFMGNWQPWLVPYGDWLFVEEGTPQFRRWLGRVGEILQRTPALRAVGRIDTQGLRRRRLIGRDGSEWAERDYRGLLVPLEWPPGRTPRAHASADAPATGPPTQLSDAEAHEFCNF